MEKYLFFILVVLNSFLFNARCKTDGSLSEKVKPSEKFRCTITHFFRKTGAGDKVKLIYFLVPKSNDYQEISNYSISNGELLTDHVTGEYYAMWDVSDDMTTESGEWFEFSIEFDYTPKSSEYKTQTVSEIYPYDTTSSIYKMYTKNYYGIFVKDNPILMKVSNEIWDNSTDLNDYAKKCLAYTVANYSYKNAKDGTYFLSYTLKNGHGDCGNLAGILISLLRTKNIPSRIVIFSGHVWAEFYLEKYGWIPVDPTFNLFGRASSSYSNQLAKSNNFVYHVADPIGGFKKLWHLPLFSHYLYPTPSESEHKGYECDISISKSIIQDISK